MTKSKSSGADLLEAGIVAFSVNLIEQASKDGVLVVTSDCEDEIAEINGPFACERADGDITGDAHIHEGVAI